MLRYVRQGTIYLLALLLLCFLILPYLWMFVSSIALERELIQKPLDWIPDEPTFDRYRAVFAERGFRRALVNSAVVTPLATVATVATGALAAYAYTRFRFKRKDAFLFGILGTQMIPRATLIIPLFFVARALGVWDTRLGLIVLYIGFFLPVVIWILRGYFVTIPVELEDSAVIDGCSRLQTLYRIVLPLAAPALVATGAYVFLNGWNEFFFALILTSVNAPTIPVAITEFSTQGGIDYGMMATAGVVGSIVPIVLGIIFQKHIIGGLTSGWSK